MKITNVGGSYNLHATRSSSVSSVQQTKIASQRSVSITGGDEISSVCGQASFHCFKDGSVYISGTKLYLDFEDVIEMNAGEHVAVSAKKIKLN